MLAHILPSSSLQFLKEFEFDKYLSFHERSVEWPSCWSQLTALTHLSCGLDLTFADYFPPVLRQMKSLQSLSITHNEQFWQDFAEGPIDVVGVAKSSIRGLTALTCLVIDGEEMEIS